MLVPDNRELSPHTPFPLSGGFMCARRSRQGPEGLSRLRKLLRGPCRHPTGDTWNRHHFPLVRITGRIRGGGCPWHVLALVEWHWSRASPASCTTARLV